MVSRSNAKVGIIFIISKFFLNFFSEFCGCGYLRCRGHTKLPSPTIDFAMG